MRETAWMFLACLLLVGIAAITANYVSFIAQNLYIIVSAIFIGLPLWLLSRQRQDFQSFGLSFSRWPQGLIWGSVCTLLTLASFVVGYYLWETQVNENKFEFSMDHYKKWPVEFEGKPNYQSYNDPGIWVWSQKNQLFLAIRSTQSDTPTIKIEADKPFLLPARGSAIITPSLNTQTLNTQTLDTHSWYITPAQDGSVTELTISRPHSLRAVSIELAEQSTTGMSLPVYTGSQSIRAHSLSADQTSEFSFQRNYLWLILWSLTHLLFVALPEEYFYRGYLQTRISHYLQLRGERHAQPLRARRIWLPSLANVITSALFALGHLLIPVGGVFAVSRLSVFFPSLVFGWLRERTNSIIAPVVYHAGCNIMVLLVAPHFFR